MNLTLYWRLSTRSQKALIRKNTHWGKPYVYRPRGHLLLRLSKETGLTLDEVRAQLDKERKYLIEQKFLT